MLNMIWIFCKNINGKRPKITKDTPEFFANLMKRCLDSDPSKRPSVLEILNITKPSDSKEGINQSEIERKVLLRLDPKFSGKP